MIKKDSPIIYICVALIGAIILTIIYHFSLENKYKICALIPALPIIGLIGLYFIILNKGNIKGYIINHIKFLLITTSLYIFTLIFLYLKYNLLLSLIISFMLWFILVNIYLLYN
jgi:uncharacterized membrane protein (GlpM family)